MGEVERLYNQEQEIKNDIDQEIKQETEQKSDQKIKQELEEKSEEDKLLFNILSLYYLS